MIDESVRALVKRIERREFFLELAPELSITDAPIPRGSEREPTREELSSLAHHGYLETPLLTADEAERCANAIRRLRAEGLHPIFAYVFDEIWSPLRRLSRFAEAILGADWEALVDFWAWHIDPGPGHAGWPPHRGWYEPIEDARGMPRFLNVWIALTDATPENSCIYIVPREHDDRRDLADIGYRPEHARALPTPAGGALAWSANAIHWGGPSSANAKGPRISTSFCIQARGCTALPALDLDAPLTFRRRLDLIAEEILAYAEKEPPGEAIESWARLVTGLRARPWKR